MKYLNKTTAATIIFDSPASEFIPSRYTTYLFEHTRGDGNTYTEEVTPAEINRRTIEFNGIASSDFGITSSGVYGFRLLIADPTDLTNFYVLDRGKLRVEDTDSYFVPRETTTADFYIRNT